MCQASTNWTTLPNPTSLLSVIPIAAPRRANAFGHFYPYRVAKSVIYVLMELSQRVRLYSVGMVIW
jgi:hypothetical protein